MAPVPFDRIRAQFEAYVGDVVYATMTTVDRRGRPRARVLIPVWEEVEGSPVGWLATFPTPVKDAHLAANPHTTFSYWSPRQNQVAVDTVAHWVDDPATRRHVWDLYARTSPPGAGYDLGRFWSSPDDPRLRVLRMRPYRIQVIRGSDLRGTIWTPDAPPGARSAADDAAETAAG
ncbi:pyridoxamine 5'-phosphate oxidase family protein [Pseudonocardia humida]|uniref:Pyridoxamine 5'-phosphate oxidase family protein n=1 Tax=Pseudonocardia humida TaxID=2800819 RepID=A0ABT1ABR4_9PSEU|nr:pyridoxamine 5'-phosphate oxidase family protein [Pseudonocardia humida]MCO1660497.1 pyridoxamine 5'-phosphate oxidase family protein [Pseudonocardia humida]